MMRNLQPSLKSKILTEFDHFLKITSNINKTPKHALPNHKASNKTLSDTEISNIKGLMRINHTGEVCAQALYYGQAFFAKDEATYTHLTNAALEEHDHLCWCEERINDFDTHTSILNPFWYASSFLLGATAAMFGDKVSYGFVMEIEKQVEDHLQEHIDQIPVEDTKTHAILKQMQLDEIRHGQQAQDAGGQVLPETIRSIMTTMSKFMKFLVYRF